MACVKICGINTPDAFEAAMAADWIGFVFVPASPRHVTPAQAESLNARHPPGSLGGGPLRVGLFVNPTDDELDEALDAVPLDILQLYTPPDRAAEIASRYGVPVWRALGIATAADLPTPGEPIAGYVLDSKPPPGAARPGGNATAFDSAILRAWPAPLPWLLAGGLTPETVAAAIAASGATAVDVSSGVERAPGVKDPALIAQFIAVARG